MAHDRQQIGLRLVSRHRLVTRLDQLALIRDAAGNIADESHEYLAVPCSGRVHRKLDREQLAILAACLKPVQTRTGDYPGTRGDVFLHAPVVGFDCIPPLGPITVVLRVRKRPQRVRWVPGGGRVPWQWSKGLLTARVPKLDIHGVLVVE